MPGTEEEGNDHALVERFLGGDAQAFEVLMARHYDRISRLAWRIVGDRTAAMEIAQETFVRAYRALPRFRGTATFGSWLYRIAVNLCFTHLRRRPGVSLPLDAIASESAAADPASSFEAQRRRTTVRAAVDALPPHYRIVIVLSSVEGLSYEEIARLLGIPLGTVKSRISTAKQMLRERLRALQHEGA